MRRILVITLLIFLAMGSVFAKTADGRPTVALVLSGGGAKGISHIPVIEAFEVYGIPIDKIYGTSMGALIGGIYCAGYSPKDLRDLVTDRDLASMFTTIETSGYRPLARALDNTRNNIISLALDNGVMSSTAVIDDYAIMNFFYNVVGNVPDYMDFNTDLETPFTCNATNMRDGSKYRFDSGNLITAMRSSMSIPIAFRPSILEDGTVLMDGGLESNFTVDEAIEDGYDIVVCVTLPKSEDPEANREKYQTMSGIMTGTLDVILRNVSRGQAEKATYNIRIDMTGYSTLGFRDPVGIILRGYEAVDNYRNVFEEIANMFTEEQKVYKNPNRRGAYFTKYPEREHREIERSVLSKYETAMSQTRLSLGFYGNLGLQFVPDGKSTTGGEDNAKTRKIDMPTISVGYYKPHFLKVDRLGLDFSVKFEITQNIIIGNDLYYLLTNPDGANKIYAYAGIKGQYGTLTVWADKMHASLSQNGIPEALVDGHGGFLLTNGKNYNLRIEANAQNLWVISDYLDNSDEGSYGVRHDYTSLDYFFYPVVSVGFVRYNPTSVDSFALDRKRFDIMVRGGLYDTAREGVKHTYMIGFDAFKAFRLTDRDSIWLDVKAKTSREPRMLRDSYFVYGGFYGMPGYLATDIYRDYIAAGVGYTRILKKGLSNRILQVKCMAGIRSAKRFDVGVDLDYGSTEMAPFWEAADNGGDWDIGGSIALGIGSYFGGNVLIGYGLNNHLTHAVYFEIH